MTLNPEFRRNLWLQLSPQRLLAAPIVLGTVFVLVWLIDGHRFYALGVTALMAYYAVVAFWGTRRAADTLAEEVSGGTWDGQRMSALGAWTMAWGKLAGGTSFIWYAGLICLAVYGLAEFQQDSPTLLPDIARLAEIGLLAQIVSLIGGLTFLRKQRSARRLPVAASQMFGLLVVFLVLFDVARSLGRLSRLADLRWPTAFDWYGMMIDYDRFVILSLAVFIGWGLVAVYRLMRIELQYRSWPSVWLAFVLFLMAYVEGFFWAPLRDAGGADAWLAAPLAVGLALVYVAVFSESKDPVRYRWFMVALRRGEWSRAAALLPQWLPTWLLAAAVGLSAVLLRNAGAGLPLVVAERIGLVVLPPAVVIAALLFALRDVLLVLLLNLSDRRRRADAAAIIYLLLLYGPARGIAHLLGFGLLLPLLAPTWGSDSALAVLAPLVEVVALLAMIRRRWSAPRQAVKPAAQTA